MGYQLATLVWLLLIVSVVLFGIGTLAAFIVGIGDEYTDPQPKMIAAGIIGVFMLVIIGWAIWVIYPLTAAGIS